MSDNDGSWITCQYCRGTGGTTSSPCVICGGAGGWHEPAADEKKDKKDDKKDGKGTG